MSVLKSINITRCNADGTIPANPVVVDLCVEEIDLKENPKYTDVNCLLSKTPDKVNAGSEPSGSLTLNLTKQSAYLVNLLFMGEKDNETDFTTATWSANTIMAVGDVVNHSDGKHSMTVKRIKGDGKTGGAEPTISGNGNSSRIVIDNNVVWEVTPLLKKADFTFKDAAPKFIVEYGIEDNGSMFYKRFIGCEAINLPLKAEIDEKVPNMQINVAIDSATDSTEAGWTTDLTQIAGAKIVKLGKDYYEADDNSKKALINGIGECIDSVELTIDKGIKIKKGLNNCNRSEKELKADGKLALDFTIAQYEKYKNDDSFTLDIIFKGIGVYFKTKFPKVKAEKTDPSIKTRTEVMLEPNIWAVEDENGILAKSEVVYPALLDQNGDIVDF